MSAKPDLQEADCRWFCPVHADEFWVPHGGPCPAPGCEETLEPWVPLSVAEKDDQRLIETLARVIENRHGTLHGIGSTLREAMAEFRREETTG